MPELVIVEVVALVIAGTITTFVGGRWVLLVGVLAPFALGLLFAIAEAADEPSAYIDFSPGEMFGFGLIAGVIVLPGWMTGVLVGTAVRTLITHRVERRPIH
jgi:hypothetical protein